ncbi:adenylyltransferase/cytidyltransferase family protein [Vibrio sp. 10N.222.54.A1]|uniref:adenylyltransferase/cytidyltransferase family protein n=1 Tax=unclassified Vibrio TaxID=2614977 RepID=UPI000C85F694|nr:MULTISPECIES: adenylyltransferase/cytidyltransferase family protein [unclassified Vibrio]PMK81556.1 glycerol-3-phosphate cytidylyltransferase [Vibrio sp. 10N.261.52.E5]TKF85398.1 glycerol-3-phosphate cytidylyltransferase [Vibrio sp. F13]
MNNKIVYVSGTFDLFHSNHLKMIKYSRGLGETLIVGVSTDELVCSYKNPPAVPFEERIAIIEGLKYPDLVIPQHTLEHNETVENLNIDIFVIGDDWKGKYDYLRERGVQVFYLPYGKGVSSTNLKEKIYSQYKKLIRPADDHPIPEPQDVAKL